tara:strand:+ start:7145 stop:7429 length:285 start_codon:yes stop_codon:yes gene_type:complete
MGLAVDVVKPYGKQKPMTYDSEKLARSINSACLSVRTPEGEAASTASHVARIVSLWVNSKPAITTHDIRRLVAQHLQRYHPDAAYYYLHQRRIL